MEKGVLQGEMKTLDNNSKPYEEIKNKGKGSYMDTYKIKKYFCFITPFFLYDLKGKHTAIIINLC